MPDLTRAALDDAIADLVTASREVYELIHSPDQGVPAAVATVQLRSRALIRNVLEKIATWLPTSGLPVEDRVNFSIKLMDALAALDRTDPRPAVALLVRVRSELVPPSCSTGETTKYLRTVVADQDKMLALFLPFPTG